MTEQAVLRDEAVPHPHRDAPCADWPYAGFWRRVAATVIDNLILLVPLAAAAFLVHPLLGVPILLAYGTWFESSPRRATPGKRACGLQVMTVGDERLGVGRALGRQALKLLGNALSVVTWIVFFVPAAFTRRRQGLHDMAVSSVVRHEPGRGIPDLAVALIGGLVPLLFVLGVVAAVALPAYRDYAGRARVDATLLVAKDYERAVERYYELNRRLPNTLGEIGMAAPASADVNSFSMRGGRLVLEPAQMAPPGVVVLTPIPDGNRLAWRCTADGLRKPVLPAQCR